MTAGLRVEAGTEDVNAERKSLIYYIHIILGYQVNMGKVGQFLES